MSIKDETAGSATLGPEQYRAIAAFRHELRRFLAFSEAAAAAVGLPAQQHQALLAIAGHAGPNAPTVGSVAQHLIIAPHTAAELVSRMVAAGLLTKAPGAHDARRQELSLTDRATSILRELTASHVCELGELRAAIVRASEGHDP